jgi:hypothetical protein
MNKQPWLAGSNNNVLQGGGRLGIKIFRSRSVKWTNLAR